jgi:hypothetical protein
MKIRPKINKKINRKNSNKYKKPLSLPKAAFRIL